MTSPAPRPPDVDPRVHLRPARALPRRWHLLRSAPEGGVRNMAIDAAMLEYARDGGRDGERDRGRDGEASEGEGILRLYGWSARTVSFGRNERTTGRYDARSLGAAGFDAVRRPTGGRALLHGDEVTYAVALPLDDSVPWRRAYSAVNALLVGALRTLGVDAQLASARSDGGDGSRPGPVRPDGPACFDAPAEGEITVGGAKLVGSAVWRERGAYLQHGSILLHDGQAELAHASLIAVTAPPRAASLMTAMPGYVEQEIVQALSSALATTMATELGATLVQDDSVTPLADDPSFVASIARHEITFRDPAWLWRR